MQVRSITFNCCESDAHAEKLSQVVDFAIGHHAPVADKDAISFTSTFHNFFFGSMPFANSFTIARSTSSQGYRMYARKDPRFFALETEQSGPPVGGGGTTGKRGAGEMDDRAGRACDGKRPALDCGSIIHATAPETTETAQVPRRKVDTTESKGVQGDEDGEVALPFAALYGGNHETVTGSGEQRGPEESSGVTLASAALAIALGGFVLMRK